MKENKTPSELKKHYRRLQYGTFAAEFVSIMTPFVVISIVNFDKYFVQYNGTQMSIAFFMAMAVMGIAIWAVSKKKLENSFITLLVGWVIFAFIFQMLGEMITDLATIMWFGLIGLVGAFGLDEASKYFKKKKELIIDAEKQAEKDNLVNAVKEEKNADEHQATE